MEPWGHEVGHRETRHGATAWLNASPARLSADRQFNTRFDPRFSGAPEAANGLLTRG
jgi:hypothetical protein